MCRRISAAVLVACLSAVCGSNSLAADMPVKAPIVKTAVLPPSWTGFYFGGGFGLGAWTSTSQPFNLGGGAVTAASSNGAKGWLATVVIGADYQFADRWVGGVFADIDWPDMKGQYLVGNVAGVGSRELNSAWAVGGRLGYLATPSTLLYATGGYTQARFGSVGFEGVALAVPGGAFETIDAATFHGFFVGAGAETQLSGNWFGRLEYRFADYGKRRETISSSPGGVPLFSSDFQPTVQTVRAELTYKFGMGPTVASAAVPVKAPVQFEPRVNWTGIYLGGGFGYGAWTANQIQLAPTGAPSERTVSFGGKGWLGTAILGADYQFADRWVVGAVADVDWTDIKGDQWVDNGAPSGAGTRTLNSAWATGARLGYLATPGTLVYATGGYTQARFSGVAFADAFTGVPFLASNAATYQGYFVGAGTEAQLLGNWFGRVEYRFADFGHRHEQTFHTTGVPFVVMEDFHPTVQTVRLAVTYKFH